MPTANKSFLWNSTSAEGSRVVAVSLGRQHHFSKQPQPSVRLLAGLGVEGDAHCGATVQHLYLKRKNPDAPNRMQVHLLQSELLDELAGEGFAIGPGELGENLLTRGIDLLALPQGTRLQFSRGPEPAASDAVIELTCLRQPCVQIERFRRGLQKRMVCDPGSPTRYRAGVMAVVHSDGVIRSDDAIYVHLPEAPHVPLTI